MDFDRRRKFRNVPDQFAFILLERDDGGAVLDISEAGLRFETFAPGYQEGPVHFWFSLNLRDRIEARGEVVWTNAARRSGGLRFLRLSEEDRAQIRKWTAEFSARDVSDEKFAPQTGADGTRGEIRANKHDAVAAFDAKARSRRSSLLAGGEGFGDSTLPSLTFQEAAEQASELVPVQRYLAAKQKQLIFGLLLGILRHRHVRLGCVQVFESSAPNHGHRKAGRRIPRRQSRTGSPTAVARNANDPQTGLWGRFFNQ